MRFITTLFLQIICIPAFSALNFTNNIDSIDTCLQHHADTIPISSHTDSIRTPVLPPITKKAPLLHSFKTDVTMAGIPWIAAGVALRNERENFRNVRNKFMIYFHNEADNYSQYLPLVTATALKACGYEGRSNWGRYLVSSAASYIVMAALVNGVKYSAKELRPDGSTRNSFPSGHTATAFAAATILHKEYGTTRSPWISIGGYALATATGCMRVLNNRHWVSDTFAGAGIGILSTELGYTLADLLFKNKGLIRNDIDFKHDLTRYPSFFNVQMGVGLGHQRIKLPIGDLNFEEFYDEVPTQELKLTTSTQVGIEGAYFFSPYIGIGGRLRVGTRKIKDSPNLAQTPFANLNELTPIAGRFLEECTLHVTSDHLSEFTTGAGVYFSLPLSKRCALGSKLLMGRSYTHGINIDAHAKGIKMDVDMSHDMVNGRPFLTYELHEHRASDGSITGNPYEASWNYLSIEGDKATNFATGLSVTYAHKSFFSWKIYLDYDFCRKTYHINYAPTAFIKQASEILTYDHQPAQADHYILPYTGRQRTNTSLFSLGAAFCVSF